ncbi:MAG: hypothetical protein IKS17_10825 [Firmicutes bacterium]|nr:hypothetical protein [Bacillota bacterium]
MKELFLKLDLYIKQHYIPEPKPMAVFSAALGRNFRQKESACVSEEVCDNAAEPMQASGRHLSDVIDQLEETFTERLFELIGEKGLSNAEVYKRACIDRKLFSKMQCDSSYKPSKKTAFALIIALELNLDEARDMLARAGYAFSPSSVFDLIIRFFIENGVYDMYTINTALYEHGVQTLV